MSSEEIMRETLQSMGFTPAQIKEGLKFTQLDSAIEYITSRCFDDDNERTIQNPLYNPSSSEGKEMVVYNSEKKPTENEAGSSFATDDDLEKAIQQSILDAGKPRGFSSSSYEVANPFERKREIGIPVGLKNVGNSCYVNSILQSYFAISQFRDKILSLPYYEDIPESSRCRLSHELQKLFSYLILSERKYIDPTSVIKTIVDKEGNQVHVGHQEDPTEFSILFFELLKESIAALYKYESKPENSNSEDQIESSSSNNHNDETKIDIKDNSDNDSSEKIIANGVDTENKENSDPSIAHNSDGDSNSNNIDNITTDNNDSKNQNNEKVDDNDNNDDGDKDCSDDSKISDVQKSDDDDHNGDAKIILQPISEIEVITKNNELNDSQPNEIQQSSNHTTLTTPLSPSSNAESESNVPFFQRLFSTYAAQKMYAEEEDGEKVQLSQKEEFMHIILNISHDDLYESLDEFTSSSHIDVFTTPKGHITSADKLLFFHSLSKVLTFQLQRVGYDPAKKSAVKSHSKFSFPKRLYMDRYLEPNIEYTMEKRKRIHALKARQSKAQTKLNKLLHSSETNHTTEFILSQAIDYASQKSLHLSLDLLQKERSIVLQQVDRLQNKIVAIKKEIDNMYNDMKRVLYHLHAVLVHDGEAGSGHYWAYLYYPIKRTWYKFNDIAVSKVDEETVWKDSFGGHHTASAYCIIYLHHSLFRYPYIDDETEINGINDIDLPFDDDDDDENQNQHSHSNGHSSDKNNSGGGEGNNNEEEGENNGDRVDYSLIPLPLQAQIADDNNEFQNELSGWESRKNAPVPPPRDDRKRRFEDEAEINEDVANNFQNIFTRKVEETAQYFTPPQNSLPVLSSFTHFLIQYNYHDLVRIEIANLAFQELFDRDLRRGDVPEKLALLLPHINFKVPPQFTVLSQIFDSCREVLELLVNAFHSHLLDDYEHAVNRYIATYERDLTTPILYRRTEEIFHHLEHAILELSDEAESELPSMFKETEAFKKAAIMAAGCYIAPEEFKNRIRAKWAPIIESFHMKCQIGSRRYYETIVAILFHDQKPNMHGGESHESISQDDLWPQYLMLKEQLEQKIFLNS